MTRLDGHVMKRLLTLFGIFCEKLIAGMTKPISSTFITVITKYSLNFEGLLL